MLSIAALVVAAALPAATGERTRPELGFERYRLENGLQVILHHDARVPMVTVNVWYHVGAANERTGRSGFAHLFEHMMLQGSRHTGPQHHFTILESIGARRYDATTNLDRTNYFQTVPRNQLETVLWLESDRMGFLLDTLDEKKLANEVEVVKNERRQNVDNRPYGKADMRLVQLLFPAPHPYNGVVMGSMEDLDAATLDDVEAFFRTYYTPRNASLVVAGDFDAAQVKAHVRKYFGSLPSGDAPPPVAAGVQAPPAGEIREELVDDVQLARRAYAWVTGPPYEASAAPLDLMATLLGGGKSSLLFEKLVYEDKAAQDVACWYLPAALGGIFACEITAKPGVALDELERAFDATLAGLRGKGPTAADLGRARSRAVAQLVRSLESGWGRADRLNHYNHHLGDPGHLAADLERYQGVTPASAREAATRWLDPEKRVVVTVRPKKGPK